MAYVVQTPVFEGPFDLLLHLILREQVDLYEISLHEITDAYLGELDRMERLDLEVATEFLLIAATLLELKARRLLPSPAEADLDEELDLVDGRDLLLTRLVECKTFKDAAVALRALAAGASRSYPRRCGPTEERFARLVPDLLEGVSGDDLRLAFLRAETPRPAARVDLSHITPVKVTLEETLAELVVELPEVGSTTFRQLTGHLSDRVEVVVRFLAVLELFKLDLVDIRQPTSFADITITWTAGDQAPVRLAAAGAYEG